MNKTLVSLLLISAAVFVTPASANWFSDVRQGINRNIGSAPNPKPAYRPVTVEAPYITGPSLYTPPEPSRLLRRLPCRRKSWPKRRPRRRPLYAGSSSSSISTSRTCRSKPRTSSPLR